MPDIHTGDMEVIIARHFGYNRNLIVPNVYWGLGFRHELDLIVVTPPRWATEIEIKISLSDLKADAKKKHGHHSEKIRQLYFAVPEKLRDRALEFIPERAGLVIVRNHPWRQAIIERKPKVNTSARKLTEKEIHKLLKLAAMRIWSLKEHIYRLKRKEVSRL